MSDWRSRATPITSDGSTNGWRSRASVLSSPPNPDDPNNSPVTAAAAGAANGATLGFADEAGAIGSTAMNALTGFSGPLAGGSMSDLVDEYRGKREQLRSDLSKIKKANPKVFLAGELAGGLASGGVAGGVPKSLGGAVVQGSELGAVAGLGGSDADLTNGEFKKAGVDVLKGAGVGGVAGAGGYAIGKGLSSLVNGKASKGLSDAAEYMSARAQGAERGTVKSLGADKVKAIGRYGLDEGIVTPLASTEDMIARNDAIKSKGGKLMGSVYKEIDDAGASTFKPLDAAVKIEDKIGDFWRSPINKGETNQLENTLETVLMRGDKDIPLTQAQTLKEELNKVANWKNKVSITDKERMARDAYGVVSDEIDKATQAGADKIGRTGLLENLKEGKRLYSGAKGAETLLENKQASEMGNKMLSLSNSAVGAGSLAAAVPTHGLSLLTVPAKIIAERYGNQIAAVSADKLSNLLAKTPEAFGKFAPILQDAARRGGNALSIANAALQKNPQYVDLLRGIPMSQGDSVSTPPVYQIAGMGGEQYRKPSEALKGEDKWAQSGLDKLGITDQGQSNRLLSSKETKRLLIEASDLPPNSKRLQAIKNQLSQGRGK